MQVSRGDDDQDDQKLSVLRELLERYREVVFSSLVTSFGLDAVLFRNDERGGHVDTLHNVSEAVSHKEKKIFKSKKHQEIYNNRGEYDPRPFHKDEKYIEKNRRDSGLKQAGELRDSYTGMIVEKNAKTDLDHNVSAKSIYDDPRRALSRNDPVKTANHESNLHSTHRSINRSKGADLPSAFIEKIKRDKTERQDEIKRIRTAAIAGPLSDQDRKRLGKLTALDAVSREEMEARYRASETVIARSHAVSYYTSRDFLGTTAINAAWAGGKMAARQCVGMVLLELSVAVQREMPAIVNRWREAPSWKEKLDLPGLLEHVHAVLIEAWEGVRARLKEFWQAAKDGIVAGVMSEIVTTVINIFTTTIKRVMRLLRNLWSGVVGALRILVLNPDDLGLEEKLAAVMRLLSVAVGGAVQPIVSEAIDKLAANVPLPSWLREPLIEFAGAAVGGVLSASLLYAIEKSPVVQVVADGLQRAGAVTEAVCHEVAALSGLAWQGIKAGTDALSRSCASPAANLVAFAACPPLGLAIYAVRSTNRIESTLGRLWEEQALIREDIGGLTVSVQTGLASMRSVMEENVALLRCVASEQARQLEVMNRIRGDIHAGFAGVQQHIERAARETAEMVEVGELQNGLNQVSAGYRDCAVLMAAGMAPLMRDLEAIEVSARWVLGKLQTSLDRQEQGAPARLPLLMSMAFAVAAWRDARAALGDNCEVCRGRAAELREVVRKELIALTVGATLWQLATEKAWLIEQHVLLRRMLAAVEGGESTYGVDGAEVRIASDAAQARMAWNDGLQPIRDLLEESVGQPSIDVLALRSFDDAEAWSKLVGLPLGVVVTEAPAEQFRRHLGIPDHVPVGAAAIRLMRIAPELANDNRTAITRELA